MQKAQRRGTRRWQVLVALFATAATCAAGTAVAEPPAWLFPVNPPAAAAVAPDPAVPVHLRGAKVVFKAAELTDLFYAPDWHPASHGPMPVIVARGRAPDVMACGFCHLPGGGGRPENAALAGLPAAYIAAQVADMRSGARGSAWHGAPYVPFELMRKVARGADDADVAVAAAYFAAQPLRRRVIVREQATVPRLRMAWIYSADPAGGQEPLGERLVEMTPDLERHERRDDTLTYVAYVPPGSLRRGRAIALHGTSDPAQACVLCHGAYLRGAGDAPPLAGRFASYLLRQLAAFRSGDRHGSAAAPMQGVVAELAWSDMIAASAYAASLAP